MTGAEATATAPHNEAAPNAVEVRDVERIFGAGPTAVPALRGVSLDVPRGALIAVRGRSGSGKTTLLNIVGGLDRPTAGMVRVDGAEVSAMTETERRDLRRTKVAFIFQAFGLLPILSAAENVGVPLRIAGLPRHEREERVQLMLDITGLGDHAAQRPGELSGGQQQRVAIARALAGAPQVLITYVGDTTPPTASPWRNRGKYPRLVTPPRTIRSIHGPERGSFFGSKQITGFPVRRAGP